MWLFRYLTKINMRELCYFPKVSQPNICSTAWRPKIPIVCWRYFEIFNFGRQFLFSFQSLFSLFLGILLTACQNWFMWWFGAERDTNPHATDRWVNGKRRNSIANALELRLFCINPSTFSGALVHWCTYTYPGLNELIINRLTHGSNSRPTLLCLNKPISYSETFMYIRK